MIEQQKNVLTTREKQVLAMSARGLSTADMAEELITEISTIKTFLHQACVKLNARNRGHATYIALKQGLLKDQLTYSPEEIVDMFAPLGPDVFEEVAQLLRERESRDQSQSMPRRS